MIILAAKVCKYIRKYTTYEDSICTPERRWTIQKTGFHSGKLIFYFWTNIPC